MRINRIIMLSMVIAFLAIAVFQIASKQKNKGLDIEQVRTAEDKTYEQGLWDGFNRTLEYLNSKKYLTKDSIKIEITELDSVLHSTKR